MSKGVGSGDKLARGANKATFSTTEGGRSVSAEKWAGAFDDYNPEEFKNAPEKTRVRNSDADGEAAGDAGSSSSEAAE